MKEVSDYQKRIKKITIELWNLIEKSTLPDLSQFTIEEYKGKNLKIELSGVKISVYPDLIVRGEIRNKKVVGAIKIHISKTNQLSIDSGKNVATILREFVENHVIVEGEKTDNRLCMSIDIFGNSTRQAPRSFKRRMDKALICCEEFVLWWNTLEKEE